MSLKPILTSRSNIIDLRRGSIGFANAWLPSRRSTELQSGGRSMARSVQVRSCGANIVGGFSRTYRWIGMAEGCCRFHHGCSEDPRGQDDLAVIIEAPIMSNTGTTCGGDSFLRRGQPK